jgi:hypothetical protein
LALFWVAEHLVGFVYFFETLIGIRVITNVRMILSGQSPKGSPDLFLIGVPGNRQNFIIISSSSHY